MAVTNSSGCDQKVTEFVKEIIRTAQQKVEEEGETPQPYICQDDENPSDNMKEEINKEETEKEDTAAESDIALAPLVQVEDTDTGFEATMAADENDDVTQPEESNPDEPNNNEIRVLHPNGESQTVTDYIRDVIEAAKRQAEDEARNNPEKGRHKNGKGHKTRDSGVSGGSSRRRSGAVRELISRFFRRGEADEEENSKDNSRTNNIEDDDPEKEQKGDEKHSKKSSFKKLFSNKQKYKVSSEALPTDDKSGGRKKKQKVGRANSIGKSIRNILSCSSSVTTV